MLTIASETDKAGPFSATELGAWRGMLQMHAQITQALDAQMRTEHGLSVSSYEVLMFLAEVPERRLRMAEIADQVLLSRSGLTRLVDRLVQLEYVTPFPAEGHGPGTDPQLTHARVLKVQAPQRTHPGGVRGFSFDPPSTTDTAALGDN